MHIIYAPESEINAMQVQKDKHMFSSQQEEEEAGFAEKMEEETIDARLKMLLDKSEDVLGQRKLDESYKSVDEDQTSDTSITSDFGPNEQVQ